MATGDEQAPFTAAISASETSQAQHSRSNDSPTDVNNNAGLARLQAQGTTRIGEEFAAAAARRTGLFDVVAAKMGLAAS